MNVVSREPHRNASIRPAILRKSACVTDIIHITHSFHIAQALLNIRSWLCGKMETCMPCGVKVGVGGDSFSDTLESQKPQLSQNGRAG
jgi:hypothetical protein